MCSNADWFAFCLCCRSNGLDPSLWEAGRMGNRGSSASAPEGSLPGFPGLVEFGCLESVMIAASLYSGKQCFGKIPFVEVIDQARVNEGQPHHFMNRYPCIRAETRKRKAALSHFNHGSMACGVVIDYAMIVIDNKLMLPRDTTWGLHFREPTVGSHILKS